MKKLRHDAIFGRKAKNHEPRFGIVFSLGGALKRTARKCVEKQDYEWELWAIPDLDSSHFLATVSAIEVR